MDRGPACDPIERDLASSVSSILQAKILPEMGTRQGSRKKKPRKAA